MSLAWALLKKGRFNIIPRVLFLTYAAYWEFPDVLLFFRQYVNKQEFVMGEIRHEGLEFRSMNLIRHTRRRLDFRYHWVDRGRLWDIIQTMEQRKFLENYERSKITMAKNTFQWKLFPGHQLTFYPSFNPPHPECLPYSSDRYIGQWPIYEMRKYEGVPYDAVPSRLAHLYEIVGERD